MNARDLDEVIIDALHDAITRLDAGEEVDCDEVKRLCVEAARRDPAVILAAALELPEVKAQRAAVSALNEAVRRGDLEAACDALDRFDRALAALKPDVKG